MSEDGEFDYSKLRSADIKYAIKHIDGDRYPKNLVNAGAALAARKSGASPEPVPILDAPTNAAYTFWVQKALGAMVATYGGLGLMTDQLVFLRRSGQFVVLGGKSALAPAFVLLLAGVIALFAPPDPSIVRILFPRVWWIYPASLLVAVFVAALMRYLRVS